MSANTAAGARNGAGALNTANPPYLSITYSPYGAFYSTANYYYVPTALLAGSQPVTITNSGNTTWDPASVKLSYRLFDLAWNPTGPAPAVTNLPGAVGPNGTVSVNGVIGPMPPGQYILCWDMQVNGTSFNLGYGVPTAQCQIITSNNTSPQITRVEEMIRMPAWRSDSPKNFRTFPL